MPTDYTKHLLKGTSQDFSNPSSLGRNTRLGEDGNSSTETLSAEERHTLSYMQRQEPQGEERVKVFSSPSLNPTSLKFNSSSPHIQGISDSSANFVLPSVRNNDCNSSISSNSNTNTLIIHHSVPQESWSDKWLSGYSSKLPRESSAPPASNIDPSSYNSYLQSSILGENLLPTCPPGVTSTLINSSLDSSSPYINSEGSNYLGKNCSLYISGNSNSKYSNSTEIPDIPSSYLDQSEVLKHLINKNTKESFRPSGFLSSSGIHGAISTTTSGAFSDQSASSSSSVINFNQTDRGSVSGSSSHGSQYINNLLERDDSELNALLYRLDHPPPAYPSWQTDANLTAKGSSDSRPEKNILLSKSQPDLTRVGIMKDYSPTAKDILNSRFDMACLENEENPGFLKELVDILTRENSAIKVELDMCRRKVAKLQKFEIEMTSVEEQYEALVKGCERREQLEKLARHKLQIELRKLTEQNNELKERFEALRLNSTSNDNSSIGSSDVNNDSASLKKELNKRDVIIAQLISQNKELAAIKERQAMEITAQRQTLNEQRTHIDILDSALTNAQSNILKLEEEVRKKQIIVEQNGQLKRLLLSIKLAADRREQSEKNLRQKLEMEILQLKSNAKMEQSPAEISDLRREIREKDEKIMVLEGEVTKWEQRFLQESTLRQATIDTASKAKELKESVFESKGVADNQNVLSNEMKNLKSKIASLEMRNRSLESYIAESELVIKSLQEQVKEPDSSIPEQDRNKKNRAGQEPSGGTSNVMNSAAQLNRHARENSLSEASGPSSSTTSQVLPSRIIPRKDEELGKLSLLLNPSSPTRSSSRQFVSNTSDLPSPSDHPSVSSSGGYCCYVSTSNIFHPVRFSEPPVDERPSKITHVGEQYFDPNLGKVQSIHSPNVEIPSKDTSNDQGSSHCKTNSDSFNMSISTTSARSVHPPPPPYYSQHQLMERSISQDDAVPTSSSHSQASTSLARPSHLTLSTSESPSVVSYSSPLFALHSPIIGPTTLPPPSPPLPRLVPSCQRPHPPNAFCRTCLNVRRSHRQNAAAFFRKANSNASSQNRRSAPSPVSSSDSLDEAPSILERLKKEWEMGNLNSSSKNTDTSSSGAELNKGVDIISGPTSTTNIAVSTPENNFDVGGLKSKSNFVRAASCTRENSCERKVDFQIPSDSSMKKHVSDLDKALNKLSFKRNVNTYQQATHNKPPFVPTSNSPRTFYNAVVSEVHNIPERQTSFLPHDIGHGMRVVRKSVERENGNTDFTNENDDKSNGN